MDTHDLGRDRGDYFQVLNSIHQPTLIVSTPTDLLYFPEEQEDLAQFIPNANLAKLVSTHGHDAFLIDLANLDCLLASVI
jgi:homoserine O-acetyltransferase